MASTNTSPAGFPKAESAGPVCPLCGDAHNLSQCPRWKLARFRAPDVCSARWTDHDWLVHAGLKEALVL